MELFKNGNLQGSEIAPKINQPFVLSKFMALERLKMRSLTYYDSSKRTHMKKQQHFTAPAKASSSYQRDRVRSALSKKPNPKREQGMQRIGLFTQPARRPVPPSSLACPSRPMDTRRRAQCRTQARCGSRVLRR
jgi:hypothetical protein